MKLSNEVGESTEATVRKGADPNVVHLRRKHSAESEQVARELVAEDPELSQGAEEKTEEAVAARDRLITIARERYDLGRDTKDEAFAVAKDGPRYARKLRGSARALRRELLREYYQRYQKGASQQATAEALATIEALAMDEPQHPLNLRVVELDGSVLLDLGDDSGRVVQVAAKGWQVLERSPDPVLFYRTNLTAALPLPQQDGDLVKLWEIVNVEDDDRPLVLAWLVQALLPEQAHPILALRGEQGSGKSSAARVLTALLDPTSVQLRKPPRSVDAWVTAATGSWIIALDNLSYLSDDMSDSLCRAVTGDGDVRRELYTDQDLVPFSFRRVVALTAIDLGALRSDLADRLLTVELFPIDERHRKPERELGPSWEKAHPVALGGLLDLAAQVLAVLPDQHIAESPRMSDYFEVLSAVDQVLGTTGCKTYLEQGETLAAEVIESDPVASAVLRLVTTPWLAQTPKNPWEGSAAQLLDRIRPEHADRFFPNSPHKLGMALKRATPALKRAHGVVVEQLPRTRAGRAWRITATTAPDSRQSEPKGEPPRASPAGRAPTGSSQPSRAAGSRHKLHEAVTVPPPVRRGA